LNTPIKTLLTDTATRLRKAPEVIAEGMSVVPRIKHLSPPKAGDTTIFTEFGGSPVVRERKAHRSETNYNFRRDKDGEGTTHDRHMVLHASQKKKTRAFVAPLKSKTSAENWVPEVRLLSFPCQNDTQFIIFKHYTLSYLLLICSHSSPLFYF
jgi:hypothetical protein